MEVTGWPFFCGEADPAMTWSSKHMNHACTLWGRTEVLCVVANMECEGCADCVVDAVELVFEDEWGFVCNVPSLWVFVVLFAVFFHNATHFENPGSAGCVVS